MTPRTRSGSPRVVTTGRSRGVSVRSCQRTCPLWLAPLVLEGGRDRCGWAQLRGAWVAGGRAWQQVGYLANASHTTAYGEVGLVPSYTGFVGRGRGRVGVSLAPSSNTLTSRLLNPRPADVGGGEPRPVRTSLLGTWHAPGSGTGPRPGSDASSERAAAPGRCCGERWPTLRPSPAGCPPWIGAGSTGWTCPTPSSTRRGPLRSL